MKRYSISMAQQSKDGIRFQYHKRTDDPEAAIRWYNDPEISPNVLGMRIVDSVTKEVVFEDLKQ